MDFSYFLLSNYLQTNEGRDVKSFFHNLSAKIFIPAFKDHFLSFVDSNLLAPISHKYFLLENKIEGTCLNQNDNFDLYSNSAIASLNDAEKYFKYEMEQAINEGDITWRELLPNIPEVSLYLHLDFPDFFFPYLFPAHFFKLHQIFEIFNIHFPPLPGRLQYKERALYYTKICRSLYEFRQFYNMTAEELCIFLYGFAPHFLSHNISEDLPQPNKVYISGANISDQKELKKLSYDTVTYWAGNEDMIEGDIVLIYEVAPRSCIASVWRALSPGYSDPFEYWQKRVWIGKGIETPPISFKELSDAEFWKDKPIVKAHMQGVSGTPCICAEYDSFLNLLENKNFDTKVLPKLPDLGLLDIELNNEHDVEIKLLEPLLCKIGYKPTDWQCQLPIRMGRGTCYYPDYAIKPTGKRGEEKSLFVWEAKFRVVNNKQLENVFYQAKSYALRLSSKGLGIVSREGIWVSYAKDDFNFERIQSFSWVQLNDNDVFHKFKLEIKKCARL